MTSKIEKIKQLIMELEDIVPYVAVVKSELAQDLLFKIIHIINEVENEDTFDRIEEIIKQVKGEKNNES